MIVRMRMLTTLAVLALAISACGDRVALPTHDYATVFALEPLASPEVRLWIQDFESGKVRGYVVRPGLIAVYSDYLGEPERREVRTNSADELIRMIPQLRRVRAERCQPVMDGGGVLLEAQDGDGHFVFEASNHAFCEGYNLHILNRALSLVQTATEPGYGTEQYGTEQY
jgi:hypothetical protein